MNPSSYARGAKFHRKFVTIITCEHPLILITTGYRLAAEVNRQHSECVYINTHTLRVLPIHFGRETVPSGQNVLPDIYLIIPFIILILNK